MGCQLSKFNGFLQAAVCWAIAALQYPIILPIAWLNMIWIRLRHGPPYKSMSNYLRRFSILDYTAPVVKLYYACQFVFKKPFDDEEHFIRVFEELCIEGGLDPDMVSVTFEHDIPEDFLDDKGIPGDHYVDNDYFSNAYKLDWKHKCLHLRVWNNEVGKPTVIHGYLPGASWDGTSCFNFVKELISRYYEYEHNHIYVQADLHLCKRARDKLKSYSLCYHMLHLPFYLLQNLYSMNYFIMRTSLDANTIQFINLDEAASQKFVEEAKRLNVKPIVLLKHAAIEGFEFCWDVLPKNIITQVSLQNRHYYPQIEKRNVVGDWLIGVPQKVYSSKICEGKVRLQALMKDITEFGPLCIRSMGAKAYNLAWHGGAAPFQLDPVYIDTYKLRESVFFNNYGKRDIVEEADFVSFNWSAPFWYSFNTAYVNGKTCITISSRFIGKEKLEQCRKFVESVIDNEIPKLTSVDIENTIENATTYIKSEDSDHHKYLVASSQEELVDHVYDYGSI